MRIKIKLLFLFTAITLTAADTVQMARNEAFSNGEELTFKVKYLFFNAAEAKMITNPDIYNINGKPTYKIDVYGRTLSIFKIFYVKDNWGTFVDTTRLIPLQSYRHIEEGNYRKHEQVSFDHSKGKANVKLFDRENKRVEETNTYDIPPNAQDIVSGFYQLRTMNLSKLKKGEEIVIKGFFDKEIYNLKLIYEGRERLSTKIGSFETLIFSPIMPNNKLFSGEFPIKVWITNDKNKIPVKIKANMVVGALDMEITEAKNLRNN
ncbi:DUF3108 domain-containing protein [Anditalea andensis]|uniref:ATP-dependent exodnase (Exonuclease V) alpha subunit-helicase superfamily I member n=1 Tax=Anditalea andensis TaxID=1048983 RepID=A0A074KZM6_9BACT|nr:DUF3108 domain-containing protein [Anditalea andensis]KEO74384.1 hypothetical protein EL17_06505 [Anditalea andensis]